MSGELFTNPEVELLAPAGSLSCALAALDAGADAVYAGLKRFNARERTENFTPEEMSKLIAYARKHGKKVYLTFNTLVKEQELEDATDEIAFLDSLMPHALIVQDLGILRMIRDYFPGLAIHGSTQMGIHNSAGVRAAAELGLSRVILERQTSLAEIREIMKNKPENVDLEVFIHGALCCCISGSCLLSSWLGGWSGNRGKCKQPCRRRHHTADGNGFFLSTQDLCTIEILPEIVNTGVRSLKIEGRLRRADYVENTVSAYRMMLDAKTKEEYHDLLPLAKERLARTCGRKWSLGYYTEQSRHNVVKYDVMGATGLLSGKVDRVRENGFELSVMRPVRIGDMLRVQPRSGDEGPAFRLSRLTKNGMPVRTLRHGETGFIFFEKRVEKDSFVYKTGEDVQDMGKRIASLPGSVPLLHLDVSISRKLFEIRAAGTLWQETVDLPEAGTRPLREKDVAEAFLESGVGTFGVRSVNCTITDHPFLPASVFKAIRQKYREFLTGKIAPETVRNESIRRGETVKNHLRTAHASTPSVPLRDSVILPRGRHYSEQDKNVIRLPEDYPSPHEELLLPWYIPEKELPKVRKMIADYAAKGGKVLRIGALCHIILAEEFPGLERKSCAPLPVCNSLAAEELKEHGFSLIQGWLELEKEGLEKLADHSPLPMEQYVYGRPILLSTRAGIDATGTMSDAKGEEFLLRKEEGLTRIFSGKVFSVPRIRNAACVLWDLSHADPDERKTGTFNFNHEFL